MEAIGYEVEAIGYKAEAIGGAANGRICTSGSAFTEEVFPLVPRDWRYHKYEARIVIKSNSPPRTPPTIAVVGGVGFESTATGTAEVVVGKLVLVGNWSGISINR